MINNIYIFIIIIILLFIIYHKNNKYEKFTIKSLNNKIKDDNELIEQYIQIKDNEFYTKFYKNVVMTNLLNNNLLDTPTDKKNNILFVTYDNRGENLDYIKIHNENINLYVKKWGYTYNFFIKCYQSASVYWCKMFIVLELLKTTKYDYVIWLDSDTIVNSFDYDIGKLLNHYGSDIFVGSDNLPSYDTINAGIFIIKNSPIGISYMEDCINYVSDLCFVGNKLRGSWAGSCYEQGVMNLLILDKYKKYTTLLPNEIIFNYSECSTIPFLMHLYAASNEKRVKCFLHSYEKNKNKL